MSRMYSGRKGKAGSTKPSKPTKLSWIRYKSKEIELLIAKMAKDEKTSSQIGLFLRDVYGIPNIKQVTGKSITSILKEKNLLSKIPEDLMALIKRSIALKKHLELNKHDMPAKRGLELTEAKIRKLVKYYKKTKKLEKDWKYDPDKIKLLVE
ncbi:MAG TPA: 30S ribosomal protein S15 [Candidatus Woesearchaeota archaeon]|nr:30S ribosomal protein S15 [Candidatus Woesearchaeota archaeon]